MSYPLLERINAPGEIKNLPASDMPALCEEIRQFLIKSVSETGGHLSSNLGVVEEQRVQKHQYARNVEKFYKQERSMFLRMQHVLNQKLV